MTTKSPPKPESKELQQQLPMSAARSDTPWKIDPETREIGRQGLAKARAVLEATRPTFLDLAA